MVTAELKATRLFNDGLAGLIHGAKLNSRVVVKYETGKLIHTLTRVTPPLKPKNTREAISKKLSSRFEEASRQDYIDSRLSPGEVVWTGFNKYALYGIGNEKDLRGVGNVKVIAELSHSLDKKGRIKMDFRNPRKRQKVIMRQRVFLQAGMLGKVIKYFQSHVGRLRAGWTVAVTRGVIAVGDIPGWVKRHMSGAHGSFVNGLDIPGFPKFTIINNAKGASNKQLNGIIRKALIIRGKAMKANALMFMRGKKHIADYAKR